jgi:glycosyltransferase involved in cell wall biosynthesis
MNEIKNLVFYYPINEGAPASVGRNIFVHLLKNRDKMPFSQIFIFVPSKYEKIIEKEHEDVRILTEKNIMDITNCLIHVPISPHLFPNIKLFLQIYAKLKRIPIIFNYHGDIRKEVILNYRNNHNISYSYLPSYVFLPFILKSSDMLIVHSYLFRDLVVEKYGVSKVKVIPNGVEDYWHNQEYELIPKNEKFIEIFYHGRLSAEKGVDILVQGFYKFLSENKKNDALLIIAGDGPQKSYLEKMIVSLKLENHVILLGNISKSSIKGYLKKVDVAIYPSIWDNFPLSYMEAFASANCPVYFSKRAGIYDFTLQSNINLYGFYPNVDSICSIIMDVCENKFDQNIIEQQKKFALEYNWDRIVDFYIDTYLQILACNG